MNPAELNLNPITQIDPIVIGAIIVIVTVTFIALRRVFVMPYLRVMEERERLFEAADALHREADEATRQADFESEDALARAAQTAEQLRTEAKERSDAYRRDRTAEASRAASEELEKGRAAIAASRADELDQLRKQAVECVGLACDQLLGKSDSELVEGAVDRLMTRRIH